MLLARAANHESVLWGAVSVDFSLVPVDILQEANLQTNLRSVTKQALGSAQISAAARTRTNLTYPILHASFLSSTYCEGHVTMIWVWAMAVGFGGIKLTKTWYWPALIVDGTCQTDWNLPLPPAATVTCCVSKYL